MDFLSPLVFALYCYLAPNGLVDEPYRVPVSYSLAIYREVQAYPIVQPEDVVATLIAEHGASGSYDPTSIGKAGERGLLQITGFWRSKYNRAHPDQPKVSKDDMLDARVNIRVGVWVIAQMQTKHTEKCSKVRVKEQYVKHGEIHTKYKPLPHNWHAHYRCAPGIRDTWRCETAYRVRVVKQLSHWRDSLDLRPVSDNLAQVNHSPEELPHGALLDLSDPLSSEVDRQAD
jgi:hypothetical protein